MTTATSLLLQPSPWQERVNSLQPYAEGCVRSAAYGIFRRYVSGVLMGYITAFHPNPQHPVFLEKKVTVEKAQSLPHKKKLIYVLKQVEELRKKMGIRREVEVYFNKPLLGLTIGSPANARGSSNYSCTPVGIEISSTLFRYSKEEAQFILVHELSHIALNHSLKRAVMATAFLCVDLAIIISCALFLMASIKVGLCVGLLGCALIEPLFFFIETYLQCKREKEADFLALKILKSSKGALQLFEGRLMINSLLRNKFLVQGDKKVSLLSPTGEMYPDINHPSLAERVAYCKINSFCST